MADESDDLPPGLSPETWKVQKSVNTPAHDLTGAYKPAASHLLHELSLRISLLKGAEERRLPRGTVNKLNYTWHELTAGLMHVTGQEQTDRRGKFRGSPELKDVRSHQVSATEKTKAGEKNCPVVGDLGVSVRKLRMSLNPRIKTCEQHPKRAGFDLSSDWTIQPEHLSCDEPQRVTLSQCVVERLPAARDPEKLQQADPNRNLPLILRHYGDRKTDVKDRTARIKSQPAAVVDEMPEPQDQTRLKMHYRINDGSSFIYYPSGCVAVCQSHSGLPFGGFYTNVFSDSEYPVILATITAFGHGTVTHPLSSAITAVWDQEGGFTFDLHGNITKKWSSLEYGTVREKMVIKVSDLISVRLLSATSAMLCFRSDSESVQLKLCARSRIYQLKEPRFLKSKEKFISAFAQEHLEERETKSNVVVLDSKINERTHMFMEVELPSAQWRRREHYGQELMRLEQRVRTTVNDWLDYYRAAVGIKCPGVERMPNAPMKSRPRREVQSSALPSLNPARQAGAKAVQPGDCRVTGSTQTSVSTSRKSC